MSRQLLKILGLTIAAVTICVAAVCVFGVFAYLKVLPRAVSNPNVINYLEKTVKTHTKFEPEIKNPKIKTSLKPEIEFTIDRLKLTGGKTSVLDVENFYIKLSFSQIFNKKIILERINLDYLFADVNKLIDIIPKPEQETTSSWGFDIFQSVMSVNDALILYNIDRDTKVKLSAKGLRIDDDFEQKQVNYNVSANIKRGKNSLNIKTKDNGHVYIKEMQKLYADDCKISVNGSDIKYSGVIDTKSNYDLKFSSDKFSIPNVIELLDTKIVENNLTEQLVYFEDIDGDFDFDVRVTNDKISGTVNLNKLVFKFPAIAHLPVVFNSGHISFDEKNIKLKNFKGYYNGKQANKIDFEGTVNDYLDSVDTDLVGNAVINDDFAKNYISKTANYPVSMKGHADTRIALKSKYNKIDLIWLYRFQKGSGFVVDGEESFMNDAANRVLAAKLHFNDNLLNIESINYYAGNPEGDRENARIPIVSAYGNIDFSNGETFVRNFGLKLPKPMPSGFINILAKQRIFKGGTFTGHFDVLNKKGCPIKIKADIKAQNVAVPSQRLFIKEGEFKTDKDNMHISSSGRYRRSDYDLSGTILNEVKFPIIVKNITLGIDEIDVDKYLQAFNAQKPTQAAGDVNTAITELTGFNEDAGDDDIQTFNLANLIIEECILKVKQGFYKDIKFSDAQANLTLDKDSMLKINSNKVKIADGISTVKAECDLKNHKYFLRLGIKEVNSDTIASSLLNLSKEIDGRASGLIELNTDDSLKLNGRIQFKVDNGVIGKVGLLQYALNVASLFRNPLTMVSPTVISDLVSIPEGRFDRINGDLRLKDNVVERMMIKSTSAQLSSFIIGRYNLENSDAALRIYTKFSNKKKGLYGILRNISLNSLANRIPLSSRNDINYYEAEISQIPPIDADEKDCQIFFTKVDGDIEHNNFISSLKKIK